MSRVRWLRCLINNILSVGVINVQWGKQAHLFEEHNKGYIIWNCSVSSPGKHPNILFAGQDMLKQYEALKRHLYLIIVEISTHAHEDQGIVTVIHIQNYQWPWLWHRSCFVNASYACGAPLSTSSGPMSNICVLPTIWLFYIVHIVQVEQIPLSIVYWWYFVTFLCFKACKIW